MERSLISCQLRTDYTGQPLKRSGQFFGGCLLQLHCNRGIEQLVDAFFGLVFAMSEQTAAEDQSKAHERPTAADRALITSAVADQVTIKAEERIPEGQAAFL